jgi:hypothetical protein
MEPSITSTDVALQAYFGQGIGALKESPPLLPYVSRCFCDLLPHEENGVVPCDARTNDTMMK